MKHKTSKLLSILLALALAMLLTVLPLGSASADTVPADDTKIVTYTFEGADAKLEDAVPPEDLDAFAGILGIDPNGDQTQYLDLDQDGRDDLEVMVEVRAQSGQTHYIDLQRLSAAERGTRTKSAPQSNPGFQFKFVFVDLVDLLEFRVRGFVPETTAGGITSMEMTVPQVGNSIAHTLPITGKLSGWYKIAGNDTASGRIQFEEVPAGHEFEADVEYYFRSDEVLTTLEGFNLKPSAECVYTISPWVQDGKLLNGEYFGPVWFYSMTPGEQEFDPNDPEAADVVFTSSAPFNEFGALDIDGEVPEDAYDVEEDSTKVTIKADYLRTLATGEEQELPVIIGSKRSDAFGLLRMKALAPEKMCTGITLDSKNAKTKYFIGEALDVSGLVLTASYSDNSTKKIDVTKEMVSGFDSKTPGSQTLTVTYESFTDTYEVEVKAETNPPQPTISYTAKDGSGNTIQSVTWQKGSGKNLDLTFKRSEDDHLTYGLFGSLEIGGQAVGSANYGTAEGSLKLSVKPEYLETLSVGDHTVKVNFHDGSATVKLTVLAASTQPTPSPTPKPSEKPASPKTGDESNLALHGSLMFLSVAAMFVLLLYARKRKTEK